MTDEELAAIRARADAATPGPWVVIAEPGPWVAIADEGGWSVIASERRQFGVRLSTGSLEGVWPQKRIEADQWFLAHSREDIPALLAEVERLRARVTALEAVRDAASANVQRLMERDAAMREIVEAVANGGADSNYGYATSLLILCPGDDAETIRDKARALRLASEGEE